MTKCKAMGMLSSMDGIDEDLWQHIKAQLQDQDAKKPVLGNCGRTVLHRAAARGLAEVVGKLLTAWPFLINEQCRNGTTALNYASANGHAAVVTQLLAACPVLIDGTNNMGDTALHCAARNGHAAVVTQLLAVSPSLAEARANDGHTALHYAAREGHTAIVTQLLAANPALMYARANNGLTVLHEAAGGGHIAIVTQLLALDPTLTEARTGSGRTALHTAAETGRAELMAQLLAANPAVINKRAFRKTALHYAAAGGHATITAQLLAARASTEVRTYEGWTVLHSAVLGGHNEIVSQLLAANPALIDARANDGATVLHYARHDGVIAQLLAARPALLDAMISDDVATGTALLNAIKLGQEETAMRMLTMHPNLICEALNGSCGWTVFHYAAYFAREKVMSWLLSAGVSEPDLEQVLRRRSTEWHFDLRQDMTALQVAAMRGHRNIVAQLLAACPSLIDVLDYDHQTGLCESTINILLEFKPAFVHAVNGQGNTLLHSMMFQQSQYSKELIERVWKMNPDALHTVNRDGKTPFHIAVDKDNDIAIDLWQGSLTFAEIANVYSHYEKSVEKLKPLMQLQCEELAVELLPGVVDIVFEYLGFRTVKQKAYYAHQ